MRKITYLQKKRTTGGEMVVLTYQTSTKLCLLPSCKRKKMQTKNRATTVGTVASPRHDEVTKRFLKRIKIRSPNAWRVKQLALRNTAQYAEENMP